MNAELRHWRPLPLGAPGWTIEYPVHGWSSRTTALRLDGDRLLVVNAGRTVSAAARAELCALGRVAALFVPNDFHHLGVRSWLASIGPVPVLAAPGVRRRLSRKLGLAPEPLATECAPPGHARLPERLGPAEISFLVPPGTRSGEAWAVAPLAAADGHAWIVGDAFFHLRRLPRNLSGVALRATGTGPGLRIGATFRALQLADPAAYRAWLLAELGREPPALLVPAHGEPLADDDLPARLRALAAARL